jgi:hypothetical protein
MGMGYEGYERAIVAREVYNMKLHEQKGDSRVK